MNGTPRLRSSWPSTPGSGGRNPTPKLKSPLPTAPQTPASSAASDEPFIPVNLIDSPSQRLYTIAVYGLLSVWFLYDWACLFEDDASSILGFLKWVFISAMYVYGVPQLRIPWLEWSDKTSHVLMLSHGVFVAWIMFRLPFPMEAWLLLLFKTVFDKELSISENSVRPGNILHNSSLIMGRTIINILPEGSAVMNPGELAFCIDHSHPTARLPIRYNQTRPSVVELLRFDFDTNSNETIVLSTKERKGAWEDKEHLTSLAHYTVKKPGIYRLKRVVDESKLEVQRRMSDTLVVRCPRVDVTAARSDKCLGDLSDLTMEIEGTPPLKIVYTRTASGDESTHRFQSIQPDNFVSPLLGSSHTSALVAAGSQDFSWARSHKLKVPLNESMNPGGKWMYSIDEIHDAAGNIANFSARGEEGEHLYPKGQHLEQSFNVHERPLATLSGCDSDGTMQVAKGMSGHLPVEYLYSGRSADRALPHTLTWKFSPLDTLTQGGDHGDHSLISEYTSKNRRDVPVISQAGLYTLIGIKSEYCEGEVKEPVSCMLLNPAEPELKISAEPINDYCAKSSVGLRVTMELDGTPPFVVRYNVVTGSGTTPEIVNVPGPRHQIELRPRNAGKFKYQFTSIDDAVYKGKRPSSDLVLEQDVKPPASAVLEQLSSRIDACIEEPVQANVKLTGERPFMLAYDLISPNGGKRKSHTVRDITSDTYTIKTDPLLIGGEYTLSLATIMDKTGCPVHLENAISFNVRHQRPKASFGHIDGKYKRTDVAGKEISLPLRLAGRGPWTISYYNSNDSDSKRIEKRLKSSNDFIQVKQDGIYKITGVTDDHCPGTVDPSTSTFEVSWLPRPQIKLADTAVLIPDGKRFLKREVCEGDIDAVEVNLIGSSPYNVKYQIRHKPEHGSISIASKEFDAALGVATIPMDTSKPGSYEYVFSELSDGLYEHDSKKFSPLALTQKVNRNPSAHFVKPGQSYRYCKEELSGDEIIAILLEGLPPFHLEIDIKHQSSSRPETIKLPNINTNLYDFRIPHQHLNLGMHHVSVRKVRDANGCQQKTEHGAPSVQVQVYDVPTIYPLESKVDYCVGERISYTLSGTAPFEVFYNFENVQRKAKSPTTTFRRIAEKPGTFTITTVADKASECKATTDITKIIHEMPSVKISKGRQLEVDIHEGGEAEILFEFWGTPPFEFTYTRSTNAKRGHKSQVLETRHDVSYEHSKTVPSSQEGTYEVVAIKDKFCSFSTQKGDVKSNQKLLQF